MDQYSYGRRYRRGRATTGLGPVGDHDDGAADACFTARENGERASR